MDEDYEIKKMLERMEKNTMELDEILEISSNIIDNGLIIVYYEDSEDWDTFCSNKFNMYNSKIKEKELIVLFDRREEYIFEDGSIRRGKKNNNLIISYGDPLKEWMTEKAELIIYYDFDGIQSFRKDIFNIFYKKDR